MEVHAFYSDPHIGHANIIKYCDRPFRNIVHMEHELIDRYNSVVHPDQTVLWVGDCFFKGAKHVQRAVLSRFNGRKVLVRGNHDKGADYMQSLGFETVVEEATLEIAGRTVRVNHFPYYNPEVDPFADRFIERRPEKIKGEILIHGHTHSPIKVQDNCICACVEAWDYRPAKLSEIEEIVKGMP